MQRCSGHLDRTGQGSSTYQSFPIEAQGAEKASLALLLERRSKWRRDVLDTLVMLTRGILVSLIDGRQSCLVDVMISQVYTE